MNTDATTIEAWLEGPRRGLWQGRHRVVHARDAARRTRPRLRVRATLCGDIEDRFDLEVDPTIVWDHPTIRSLSHGISDRLAAAA